MTAGFCSCFRFYFDSEAVALLKDYIFSISLGETLSYLKSTKPETRNYITPQRHMRAYGDALESSKS